MVKELIAAGLEGDALLREVMRLTGLPVSDASELIAIETGESHGDTDPPIAQGKGQK